MSNLNSFTDIRTWSAAMFIFILMVLHNTAESLILRNTETDQKGNSLLLNHPNEPTDWEHRAEDNSYFPVVNNGLFEIQSRVAFSVDEPSLPPSEGIKTRTKRAVAYRIKNIRKKKRRQKKLRKNKRKNRKQNKKRRHNHGIKKSRRRRSSRTGHSEQYDHEPLSVCDSISEWVQLNESITQYDLPVQVLSHRWSGGQRLKQFIYETKCVDSGQSCRGIDTDNFRSECVTKKIYIDAFVRDVHGDEMWAKIEVNGSCNCRLFRKRLGSSMSIFDFLGQNR
ncbi:uncharacterized protein LOC133185993 [Saccostrea echinata]|uniref:uncharacterized protein LOC133185993 n=1 Tax=Saccostrea echinata TaxID=191078 RepID=UPI002A805222|nr:uncharacterized protein LOC133185993 [Saccostrea echinata]